MISHLHFNSGSTLSLSVTGSGPRMCNGLLHGSTMVIVFDSNLSCCFPAIQISQKRRDAFASPIFNRGSEFSISKHRNLITRSPQRFHAVITSRKHCCQVKVVKN